MRRPLSATLLASASILLAGAASAAEVHHFDIPAKPVGEALIDFAIQANISLGGAVRCEGRSQPVVGDFSIEAGLSRLLAGGGCRFVIVAPDTVKIVAQPRTPMAPARSAAPAAVARAAQAPSMSVALPEVIVTATRRPAVAAKLADSISVLGANAIMDAGATDASDIAAQLAGVTTTNLGPGRDKILLRGLSDGAFTGRTESTVGIYLDDAPVTFNAPDPDLRLVDIKSVEVLRGPQGFLYGGGSMSGVYRIVTQPPQLNLRSESMLIGGALTEAGAPSGEAEAVANLPLVHDVLAVRAVGYDESDGGYIDNVALRKSNIDGTTRAGGRLAIRLLAPDAWTITTGGVYQRIVTNDTQYVTPGLGRQHVANQIVESSDNHFAEANLTVEHSGAQADFRSTTAVVDHEFFAQTDASTALLLFGGISAKVGAYDENSHTTRVVEDATLTSPNVGRLQWLVGAFGSASLETSTPDVRADANGPIPSQLLYVERRTDRLYGISIFGQASYALTDQLTVEAGIRGSASEVVTESLVSAPLTNQRRRFSDRLWNDGFSPKLAIKYQIANGFLAYVLGSEGHRPGGFNTGGPIGTTFSSIGPGQHRQFGADQLWNLEVGLKATAFDDRLRLRSALFYDIWNNIQTDQFLTSGLSYTANAGDGRNYGAETELVWLITPRLNVQVNALANAPELLRGDPGFQFPGHVGLPGVPDISGGGRISYSWPVGRRLSAQLAAQSQYVGHSRLTFDPSTSPRMGGYTIDQISAELKSDRWRLQAFVMNPTNESGNTFSYGNPFNFRQIAEVTPQRPLTFRMTLGVDF